MSIISDLSDPALLFADRHSLFWMFCLKTKASGTFPRSLVSLHFTLILYRNDLTLVVASASLAHSVRHHKSSALAALYQVGSAHLPVCSAAVSSRFGRFILRTDRHGLHLLQLFKNILDN